MTPKEMSELETIALKVREHIIRMSTDGGCFTGASLSCTDLLVFLYSRFLNITPNNLHDPERDYLFLSKGHDVPALYGTLAELGILERKRLTHHLKMGDSIYWHPNQQVSGVEFHSGSLGHLLCVAVGVAMDCKLRRQNNKIVVIVGDGELNEGSNWEACLVAHAYNLDNLIVIVDRNGFQANLPTEALIPLEPLEYKFMAFGFSTLTIDGHDFADIEDAFAAINPDGKPFVIIADTVRGKGLPSIERRADRWFCNFSHDEVERLLHELHTYQSAQITSEAIIAR
jgi:transketolase